MNASFSAQVIAMVIIFPFLMMILIGTGQRSLTSNPLIFLVAFVVHSILANAIDKNSGNKRK
jgi:hypothetical protein